MTTVSEKQILKYLEEVIEDPSLFVVELELKGDVGAKKKVGIYLDGDDGVSIEKCSKISRKLAARLEEDEIMSGAYTLEVSSYGVGKPLKLYRQYVNNKGRLLKVDLENGKSEEGQLHEVDENKIVLSKKKKKKENELVTIDFKEIVKSQVLISFN
jgi:ribosome maturation factor RimP